MKRIIRADSLYEPNYNIPVVVPQAEDDWIPPMFNEKLVDDIINRIRIKCQELYSRRFPNLYVEFDDEYWGSSSGAGGKMHVNVALYSNGVEKAFDEFEFHSQNSYWEESDFQQDINIAVSDFCENLV